MGHSFNSILEGFAVDPREVCLLRHQTGPFNGRTPYTLWRDDPASFIAYQGVQTVQNPARLSARYWASFVVTPAQSTLFVGLYAIERLGQCGDDVIDPLRHVPATQGGHESWNCTPRPSSRNWRPIPAGSSSTGARERGPGSSARAIRQSQFSKSPARPGRALPRIQPLHREPVDRRSATKWLAVGASGCARRLSADMPPHPRAICRFGNRGERLPRPLDGLCARRPRRQCRPAKPRSVRLSGQHPGGKRLRRRRRGHSSRRAALESETPEPGNGLEPN